MFSSDLEAVLMRSLSFINYMETSIFLARVIGLFLAISTLSMLINYKKSIALEQEAIKNPALAYFSGFTILAIGILLIVSHSVFEYNFKFVITVLGWIFFFKGLIRIFFPDAVGYMLEKKRNNRWFIVAEVVVFLAGIYLMYYGFIAS